MKFENTVDSVVVQEREETAKKYPMKWYKFLIWFCLPAIAVGNVGQGIVYITGLTYRALSLGDVSAEQVYAVFGSWLKAIDVIFGITMFALAVLGVFTWVMLKKHKRAGPVLLLCLYGFGGLVPYMYGMACLDITGSISPMFLVGIAAGGGMVALNHAYFSKRSELFKN